MMWRSERWVLMANGPGARLVDRLFRISREAAREALGGRWDIEGVMSVGFCGALDPALRVGDIVQEGVLTLDRVAVTAAEKRELRERTHAAAVEMESAAVEAKAREWGVEFRCVKAVSDLASEDLPFDFNRYRDVEGRFSRGRIAAAAILRPARIPALMRLDRNCRIAAEKLGEFLTK